MLVKLLNVYNASSCEDGREEDKIIFNINIFIVNINLTLKKWGNKKIKDIKKMLTVVQNVLLCDVKNRCKR